MVVLPKYEYEALKRQETSGGDIADVHDVQESAVTNVKVGDGGVVVIGKEEAAKKDEGGEKASSSSSSSSTASSAGSKASKDSSGRLSFPAGRRVRRGRDGPSTRPSDPRPEKEEKETT